MKLMIRLNQNCIHFRMIKYEFGIDNSIVYSKSLFVFIFICPAEMWYLTAKTGRYVSLEKDMWICSLCCGMMWKMSRFTGNCNTLFSKIKTDLDFVNMDNAPRLS